MSKFGLALIDGWEANQAGVSGYIDYKGNHEAQAPYAASRQKVIEYALEEIAAGRKKVYWEGVLKFHQEKEELETPHDFQLHDAAVYRVQGGEVSLADRILSSIKAGAGSPFNGLAFYLNNRKTNSSLNFMTRIAQDRSLGPVVRRLSLPVLLIYGGKDLVAPPEIGKDLYDRIGTPADEKELLILPNSRHGAEGEDVRLMVDAIRGFVQRFMK